MLKMDTFIFVNGFDQLRIFKSSFAKHNLVCLPHNWKNTHRQYSINIHIIWIISAVHVYETTPNVVWYTPGSRPLHLCSHLMTFCVSFTDRKLVSECTKFASVNVCFLWSACLLISLTCIKLINAAGRHLIIFWCSLHPLSSYWIEFFRPSPLGENVALFTQIVQYGINKSGVERTPSTQCGFRELVCCNERGGASVGWHFTVRVWL